MCIRSVRLVAGLAMLAVAACDETIAAPEPLEELPRSLTASEKAVIRASNDFAFGLLREVVRGEVKENVVLSPLSASMALGMTMNGAGGETREAMRKTLGFGESLGFGALPLAEVNASYRGLMDLLPKLDRRVDVRLANSIWYRQGFPVESAFLATVRGSFGAEVSALDFGAPGAVRTINGWVDRGTNGKIDRIVDEIPGDVVMYLLNAVYFKGRWTDQFDPARTRDERFTTSAGNSVPVKMMSRDGTYGYARTSEYELVDLPYGAGAYSMAVLLPAEGKDVDEVVAGMTSESWEGALANLGNTRIALSLPRFKVEYATPLNESLTRLGMGIIFTPESDFTPMSSADPWVDLVFQKTFIEVNEEGTEAAAVTGVTMVTSAPPSVVVDRPFLFAIRERFSGTLLFVGKIGKP